MIMKGNINLIAGAQNGNFWTTGPYVGSDARLNCKLDPHFPYPVAHEFQPPVQYTNPNGCDTQVTRNNVK